MGPAQLCSGLHGYGATRVQLGGTTLRCQPNAVYCAKGAARTRPRRGAALELSRLVWCGCAGRCRRAVAAGRLVRRVRRGPNRRRRRGPQATARLGYQAVVMRRRTLSTAASGGANQDGSVPSRGTPAAWTRRLMSAISCTSVTRLGRAPGEPPPSHGQRACQALLQSAGPSSTRDRRCPVRLRQPIRAHGQSYGAPRGVALGCGVGRSRPVHRPGATPAAAKSHSVLDRGTDVCPVVGEVRVVASTSMLGSRLRQRRVCGGSAAVDRSRGGPPGCPTVLSGECTVGVG